MSKKSLELDLSKLIGFKQVKATYARAQATRGTVQLQRPQSMVGVVKKTPASPDLNA
jgi:hypothetical protein